MQKKKIGDNGPGLIVFRRMFKKTSIPQIIKYRRVIHGSNPKKSTDKEVSDRAILAIHTRSKRKENCKCTCNIKQLHSPRSMSNNCQNTLRYMIKFDPIKCNVGSHDSKDGKAPECINVFILSCLRRFCHIKIIGTFAELSFRIVRDRDKIRHLI